MGHMGANMERYLPSGLASADEINSRSNRSRSIRAELGNLTFMGNQISSRKSRRFVFPHESAADT